MGEMGIQPVRYFIVSICCFMAFLVLPAFARVQAVCTSGSCSSSAPDGNTWCAGSGTCTAGVYPGYCNVACPPINCAHNEGCGTCNGGNLNYTLVDNWTCPSYLTCSQATNPPCSDTAAPTCILNTNCADACHPTWCQNVTGILGGVTVDNPTGIANYDDCSALNNYICGYCGGIGPNPPPGVTPLPTPTPVPGPGTIQARAMWVSGADTSCIAVHASTTGVGGTVLQFTPSSASQPAPQTQSGSSYVIFSSIISGLYTINSQTPAQYVFARAC